MNISTQVDYQSDEWHSNVTMTHLRRLWLQSTSVSVLEESLDYTKFFKTVLFRNCDYIRLKGQRLNPLTHRNIQVNGGDVSSDLTEFRGLWLPNASHITL